MGGRLTRHEQRRIPDAVLAGSGLGDGPADRGAARLRAPGAVVDVDAPARAPVVGGHSGPAPRADPGALARVADQRCAPARGVGAVREGRDPAGSDARDGVARLTYVL